ncbi:MAG: phage protein GemA/Gp16 family protein, partial [bacterium]
ATNGHKAKIHVLAKRLEMDVFDLHLFVKEITGKHSIKALTTTEAGSCLDEMERLCKERGTKNIPNMRVSGKMRGKILKYMHLLEWKEYQMWGLARKVCQHDIPFNGSNHDKFNWLTRRDGWKLFEALRAIYDRKQKTIEEKNEKAI